MASVRAATDVAATLATRPEAPAPVEDRADACEEFSATLAAAHDRETQPRRAAPTPRDDGERGDTAAARDTPAQAPAPATRTAAVTSQRRSLEAHHRAARGSKAGAASTVEQAGAPASAGDDGTATAVAASRASAAAAASTGESSGIITAPPHDVVSASPASPLARGGAAIDTAGSRHAPAATADASDPNVVTGGTAPSNESGASNAAPSASAATTTTADAPATSATSTAGAGAAETTRSGNGGATPDLADANANAAASAATGDAAHAQSGTATRASNGADATTASTASEDPTAGGTTTDPAAPTPPAEASAAAATAAARASTTSGAALAQVTTGTTAQANTTGARLDAAPHADATRHAAATHSGHDREGVAGAETHLDGKRLETNERHDGGTDTGDRGRDGGTRIAAGDRSARIGAPDADTLVPHDDARLAGEPGAAASTPTTATVDITRGDDGARGVAPAVNGDAPAAPSATHAEAAAGSHRGADSAISPWADRVVESVRVATLRGGGEMRLRLEPAGLGHIDVRITLEHDGIRASIVAEHDTTRALLRNEQHLLHAALERSDLRLAGFSVDLGSGGSPGAFADGERAATGLAHEAATTPEIESVAVHDTIHAPAEPGRLSVRV